jgi:hypothetical protein
MMTPKAFDAAMEDWKREREILRMTQFYSLPAEAMGKIKNPENLYSFPWESPITPLTADQIDWTTGE